MSSSSYGTDAYWAERAAQVEAELLTRIPENKIRPRLEPTRRAVQLLGDPQTAYRVIHVTGTNGKTSTTRFIERILREHGLRTGRFTSPHLVSLNERMSVDGEPVSDERLAEVWAEISPILEIVDAELIAAGEDRLTFFEALAALGFAVFADAPVDVLVLEVGMGGEWDSTNVADGDVAVFTPISLDHVERLGKDLTAIATTKSGIIKPGALVVSAAQPAEVLEVLRAKASATADSFAVFDEDFSITEHESFSGGQKFSLKGLAGQYYEMILPIYGTYQAENAVLAVAAVEAFLGGGTQRIMDDVLRPALADVSSPGRLQVISRSPVIILDAAHNPAGAKSLSEALKTSFLSPFAVAVISILEDKDAKGFLEAINDSIVSVVITKSSSPRAMPVEELAALAVQIFGEDRVETEERYEDALAVAKTLLPGNPNAAIIVTGSITLVGDALKVQQKADDLDA